jgi:hypothetical protein
MDIISNSKEQSVVLNMPEWMSRATLDAIGEGRIHAGIHLRLSSSPCSSSAAFDVHFGSIDNNESALARSYSSMMSVLTFARLPVFPNDIHSTLFLAAGLTH